MLTQCLNRVPPCVDPVTGETITDPDSPFRNLSSERPDAPAWTGDSWGPGGEDDPLYFYKQGCLSLCVSSESQADADACAERQAALCVFPPDGPYVPPGGTHDPDPWQPPPGGGNPDTPGSPGGGPPPGPGSGISDPPGTGGKPPPGGGKVMQGNTEQTCSETCPDGSTFTKSVAAETYLSDTQNMANAKAHAAACELAAAAKICLGDMPWQLAECCTWHEISGAIDVTGLNAPYNVTVSAGALPAGLTGQNKVGGTGLIIEGTPETGGTFNFTLLADDGNGNTNSKDFHIHVYGIAQEPGDMPDGLINYFYEDYVFTWTGDYPVVTWAASGLPAGMEMDPVSGAVSGTPTESGAYQVAVTGTDSAGRTCTNIYNLYIYDCSETFSGAHEITVNCGDNWVQEFTIPPAPCDRTVHISARPITCAETYAAQFPSPPGCCVYGQNLCTIEITRTGYNYSVTLGDYGIPYPPSIDADIVLPATPERNAEGYRVRVQVSQTYTADYYCCGSYPVRFSGF